MNSRISKSYLLSIIFISLSFVGKSTISDTANFEKSSMPGGAYLLFANKFGGELSLKELKTNSTLSIEGCAKGSRLYQFTLHTTKSGKKKSHVSKDGKLNKKMLTLIRSLSPGDEFTFSEVKAYLPNSKDGIDVMVRAFSVV